MIRLLRTTVFLAAALCAAAPAWADNDGDAATENIARVVPYDGVLDLDGAGYNGLVDVIFTLYDASDAGNVVWTETWSSAEGRAVTITGGRFSVNLGTYEDIEPAIADAGQLYLGLQVKLPESDDYTALSGRQRLNPVPYALWGARASNLEVGGAANVGGDVNVGGVINVPRLNTGGVYIDQGGGDYRRALSFLNNSLYIGVGDSFGDGVRFSSNVRLDRVLRVDGTTTLTGTANLSQSLNLGGNLNMADGAGNTNALRFVDNYLRLGTSGRYGNGVLVPTNFRVQSSADVDGNLNVDGNATVDGTLSVGGDVSLSDCRICLNTLPAPSIGDRGRYTCVALNAGSRSPSMNSSSRVIGGQEGVTTLSLVFLCDGGGTTSGQGNIDQNGNVR